LETKNHRGKIVCYGDSWTGIGQNPFTQARFNASRVHKVIKASEFFESKLWVQAVVVFANKEVELDRRKAPFNVRVLKIEELTNYITQEKTRLSPQEIELMSKEILNVHSCQPSRAPRRERNSSRTIFTIACVHACS
jgi:hypothetical protein